MKKKVFVVVVGCSVTVVVLEVVHCGGSCVVVMVVTIVHNIKYKKTLIRSTENATSGLRNVKLSWINLPDYVIRNPN